MNMATNNSELRRPFMVDQADPHGFGEQLIDDVAQIIQRTAYIEIAPKRFFTPALTSELADAVDRLSVKVSKLQEAQGAGR